MQQSPYAQAVPTILAQMQEQWEKSDQPAPPDDQEGQRKKLYAYRTEDGKIVFSDTLIEEEEPEAPIIQDTQPEADQRSTQRRIPSFSLIVLLLFCLFLFLDSLDTTLTSLFTPTATITIVPKIQTISLQSTARLGKLLSPITLSESQTAAATGHGHQDATFATGTLTFYNGSFSSQTIKAGTIYTGADGIQVATDQTIIIPAANPPYVGQATIAAHALTIGATGNINAGDIAITTTTLQVKNNAFHGGQDARDFSVVKQSDINITAASLTGKVTGSMDAALQQQLLPTEQSAKLPCHPTIYADHHPGEEAAQVIVTVSETCTIVAFNNQELTAKATQLLRIKAQQLETGYNLFGSVQVSITKVATQKPNAVLLSFRSSGTWVYHVNEQSIAALIAGKPRQEALHLLSTVQGIQRVNIAGIPDNNLLPLDRQHINFLVVIGLSWISQP